MLVVGVVWQTKAGTGAAPISRMHPSPAPTAQCCCPCCGMPLQWAASLVLWLMRLPARGLRHAVGLPWEDDEDEKKKEEERKKAGKK